MLDTFRDMVDGVGAERDLSTLVLPRMGAVRTAEDLWEPVRVVDAAGVPIAPVAAFLKELQAMGRSAATQRSYAMDLLRWFRFVWAVEIGWDQATRGEARDSAGGWHCTTSPLVRVVAVQDLVRPTRSPAR